MAAALATPSSFNLNGIVPVVCRFNKATQNDWVYLNQPGGINMPGAIAVRPILYTGEADTFTYLTATVYNASTAHTATTTSIVVVGAPLDRTATGCPFIVETTSGEFMEVLSDSAPTASTGTWVLKRGCYGTTASATGLTNGSTIYLRNGIKLTGSTTGYVTITFYPLPANTGMKLFST